MALKKAMMGLKNKTKSINQSFNMRSKRRNLMVRENRFSKLTKRCDGAPNPIALFSECTPWSKPCGFFTGFFTNLHTQFTLARRKKYIL